VTSSLRAAAIVIDRRGDCRYLAAVSNEDDEIRAYQARLKKPALKVSPQILGIFAVVIGTFAVIGWKFSRGNTEVSSSSSGPPAPPAPPTPRELTQRALEGVADTYAGLDETSLPEAPIALAKGRKVVFVRQSLGFDPETARLLSSPVRTPTKTVELPRDFQPGTPPELAVDPGEVGVVVLARETMTRVGTYTGGNEPAIEVTNDLVAILVPEKKRIAAFKHTLKPKMTATRLGQGKSSVLVGALPGDDEGWMGKAAAELHEGRAPESTTTY
jgi:hypothetical protein